jgi:hypothetical protein
MQFDIIYITEPALLDIKNLSSSNIIFQGVGLGALFPGAAAIENPIGETRILNTGGNIVTSGPGMIIRTNTLGDPFAPVLPKDFERLPGRVFTGTVTFAANGAAPDTITLTGGAAWVTTVGLQVGDLIKINNAGANSGVYQVAAISGSIFTLNTSQSVVAATTADVTVTPFHGIEATLGSVGTEGNRIRVDLVRSTGRDEHLFAEAGVDVALSISGRLRLDPGATNNFLIAPLDVDLITALDDVFVELRSAHVDSDLNENDGVRVTVPSEPHDQTYKEFFRPDTATGSALRFTPPNYGAYAWNAGNTIAMTVNFGLIEAGSNIDVDAADPAPTAPRINVNGITNITATAPNGTQFIDVKTNGWIVLEEIVAVDPNDPNDLLVGQIWSTSDDVTLIAPRSILDADASDCTGKTLGQCAATDPFDVRGVNITLIARTGSIGTQANFLEIDLLDFVGAVAQTGVLNADAGLGVYIDEVGGDLRVEYVVSRQNDATQVTDVALTTRAGWILDFRSGTNPDFAFIDLPNVEARRIDLGATGGGIGLFGNDFDINSSVAGKDSGRLFADADMSVYVTETDDELSVLAARSRTGDVRLTIPDTASPRGPPAVDPGSDDPSYLDYRQPEDLILIVDGLSLIDQSTPLWAAPSTDDDAETRSGIWAKNNISLWVGDDILAPTTTEIVAGGIIDIHGDTNRIQIAGVDTPSAINADPGFGSNMDFLGVIGGYFDLQGPNNLDRTTWSLIYGHTDVDLILFSETYLGAFTRVYGSQNQSALDGPDGDDEFAPCSGSTTTPASTGA